MVQLERKAQEANTVDEQLNIQLQAVEMQISMVRFNLQSFFFSMRSLHGVILKLLGTSCSKLC